MWRRAGRARDLRADVAALVGSFAEAQTMLVTVGSGLTATFVVATGQPSGAEFAAHGHLVRVIPKDPDTGFGLAIRAPRRLPASN